jgi:hypothetical protein
VNRRLVLVGLVIDGQSEGHGVAPIDLSTKPGHRHSGIKFVTPHQRHNGDAMEICHHRAVVYEQARQRNPRRWSRSTRCWHQPEVVWINPLPAEIELEPATLSMAV